MSPPRRNYIQKSGRKVYGVTSQDILNKPGLPWWGYNQGLDNYTRLSETIGKILNDDKDMAAASKLEKIQDFIVSFEVLKLYDKRDEAGDAGTLAHELIENHFKNLPPPDLTKYPETVRKKAEGCYQTCLNWAKRQQIKVIDSEVALVSEIMPVGGTIDYVIETIETQETPGAVEILDFKTGKDIYLGAKIQVAKYKVLWLEHHPDRPVTGLNIVRLGENGDFNHKYYAHLDGYDEIFDWMSKIFYKAKDLGEKI